MKKKKTVDKESQGAGWGAPVGYKKIAPDDEKPLGEPYREYPWSPKSKESLPEDAPEAAKIEHYGFPFRGRLVQDLQFKRSEDRVNKNPNATQKFVERLKAAYAADEGPKAPPKVPGQPDVVEDKDLPPPKGQFFPDFIAKIKQAFPELKQTFTDPPTYVWNPKGGPTSKLDAKKIKDSIKMKFPKVVWTTTPESAESAEVVFDDGTRADIHIGSADADHLTVIYHVK